MSVETELLNSFKAKGIGYGQELIVLKAFCNEFIQASRIAGLAVIGIEGFCLLQNGSVKPILNEIADFSDMEANNMKEYIQRCGDAAENFIQQMLAGGRGDGYCFTLTDSVT